MHGNVCITAILILIDLEENPDH